MSIHTCPTCGQPIEADKPCPSCLLQFVASPPEFYSDMDGHSLHEIQDVTQTFIDVRSSTSPTVDIETVRAAFPHLEIIEHIGRGGMGTVFKVRQPQLDRIVALKILPAELESKPGFAERFAQEGKLLARLNHPNIVAVYDFGESGGYYHLLMEYVDGVNLRQAMQEKRFNPEQAIAIIPKICEALQYAHEEGVLHRDIKPANILLDTKGRVKIADFGLAKMMTASEHSQKHESDSAQQVRSIENLSLTQTGQILGTPNYMAPEQFVSPNLVDHRADIYTPLHNAVVRNPNADVLRHLISISVDVNVGNNNNSTPLHSAAFGDNSNVEVFKYLVAQGADVNATNNDGQTPLHYAARNNTNVEVVRYLLAQGADVNARNQDGHTPLDYAAQNPNEDFVKHIISQGADVNTTDNWSSTPLIQAARHNSNVDVLRYLVSQGANVNARNNVGFTPLYIAARDNLNAEVLRYLVSQGADVHVRNNNGNTPLHTAARYNSNVEVLRYLISQGTDVNTRCDDGRTPLDVANTDEKRTILRAAGGRSGQ